MISTADQSIIKVELGRGDITGAFIFLLEPFKNFKTRIFFFLNPVLFIIQEYLSLFFLCPRGRGQIPVRALSRSEGGRHRQGDDQAPVSRQHRQVSPAILVLHARLAQDGDAEGDLV